MTAILKPRRPVASAAPRTIRVAVYTRKSTEEGLDQQFNSLDAQREAVEAYVKSQAHEGWATLPDRYDDGGYTGANIDRPAFQRLMAAVQAGQIDVVAVYKIDRLSRSLLDFTRVLSIFKEKGVSFVSVTQQFSTSTSMGQFTLNILMSFAEFERQMISERTRDKIAASRRRGLWVGGAPVLGYDVREKKLVANESEADQVRAIFALYLDLGSLIDVASELNRRGWTTKTRTTRKGLPLPGRRFDKHSVRRLLTNVLYIGKVGYRNEVHPGQHAAILDEATFEAAAEQLRHHGRTGGREVRNKWGALLKGLMRCARCGSAMSHVFTAKGAKRFHYYACQTQMREGAGRCPKSRAPAHEIERFVVEKVRALAADPSILTATVKALRTEYATARPPLVGEARRIDQDIRNHAREREGLLTAASSGGPGTPALLARLGEIDDEIKRLEDRAAEVRRQLAALDSAEVDEDAVAAALARFDPIWDELFPRERARLLQLMIEAVTYDGQEGTVQIRFRPNGLRVLADGRTG